MVAFRVRVFVVKNLTLKHSLVPVRTQCLDQRVYPLPRARCQCPEMCQGHVRRKRCSVTVLPWVVKRTKTQQVKGLRQYRSSQRYTQDRMQMLHCSANSGTMDLHVGEVFGSKVLVSYSKPRLCAPMTELRAYWGNK